MTKQIVLLGTLAGNPYAGMAWMHFQILVGLLRLGHDAYYFETTSAWPFDPRRNRTVPDSEYSVPYLAALAESFGVADRWAYRRSYSDKAWLGRERAAAEDLLAHADLVLNVAGSTPLAEEDLKVGRLVLLKLVAFLARRLAKAGVDVRLGRVATAGLVQELEPDAIVLATGASYRRPLGRVIPLLLASRWAQSRALKSLLKKPGVKRLFSSGLRRPNVGLERRLRASGFEVHRIGDCHRPGRTPEAMLEAARLAYRL